MYKIRPSVKFQKDLKRAQKRGYDISLLTKVLNLLANGEQKYGNLKKHLPKILLSGIIVAAGG
jgi:hypothetical protein